MDNYKKQLNKSYFAMNETAILTAFFDNSQHAGILLHADGTIARANRKLCKSLGYKDFELLDKDFSQFVYEKDKEKTINTFELSKVEGSVFDFSNRYIPKHLAGAEIGKENESELVTFLWKSSFSINDFTIGEAVVCFSE